MTQFYVNCIVLYWKEKACRLEALISPGKGSRCAGLWLPERRSLRIRRITKQLVFFSPAQTLCGVYR